MNNDVLNEKLYTSTEVAEILGVSLRSIYRYLEEEKIVAAVKTATGRHRFTKQNINDFLYPSVPHVRQTNSEAQASVRSSTEVSSSSQASPSADTSATTPVGSPIEEPVVARAKVAEKVKEEVEEPKVVDTPSEVKEEPVDWLAKFRQAAQKYKEEEVAQKTPVVSNLQEPEAPKKFDSEETEFNYYRSGVGGLKEVAQSLDKSAKNASLEYAFTMNAGISLHKPIKPFSIIHSYIRGQDKNYFEKALQLSPSSKDSAQLCLITTWENSIFEDRNEMHGLFVVSNAQLKRDLINDGEAELAQELD